MEQPGYICAGLVEKYSGIGLNSCGMKKYQKCYFPKLTNLPYPLESYLICENESDLMIELDRTRRLLETTQQENQQMSQLIMDLNSQIERI
ncbi:17064_t:CDS:2, partial [Gigaspora margarita]